MAELTNLTDRIAHLRDRKHGSPLIKGEPDREKSPKPKKPKAAKRSPTLSERRFAADYFGVFAYTLLALAIVTQMVLIVWLDLM